MLNLPAAKHEQLVTAALGRLIARSDRGVSVITWSPCLPIEASKELLPGLEFPGQASKSKVLHATFAYHMLTQPHFRPLMLTPTDNHLP